MIKKYINNKKEIIVAYFLGENVQYGIEDKKISLLKNKKKFQEISKNWKELK